MALEHVDILVVGAGLSGIGAGYHLQTRCPGKSYAILEAREAMGGTWDLFRYPGVRSDSDMHTLGYSFRPWTGSKTIADGDAILNYLRETASEFGIDRQIRYQHRVSHAEWSSADARWTLEIERGPARERLRMTCNFLYLCCGYYRYDAGHMPDYPGAGQYRGRLVHPQQWTQDIDVADRRVVVIGSGATAITLVPSLARHATQVTLLQRSPSYVVALPDHDSVADTLRSWLPARVAHAMTRWKNVLSGIAFFQLCRFAPTLVRNGVIRAARKALGPAYHVEKDFAPDYRPWDQRMCLAPNGDLFKAIGTGRACVVTDHIDTFTERGIRLRSGAELEADVVVSATGLEMLLFGGLSLSIDGRQIDLAGTLTYKGMMCSDVPNLFFALGYTNASWTLRCDLTAEYVCRLIHFMDRHRYGQCTPRHPEGDTPTRPLIDFSSGYVQRSIDRFPKQGARAPWRLYQNYVVDLLTLRFGDLDDGVMAFNELPAAQVDQALARVASS